MTLVTMMTKLIHPLAGHLNVGKRWRRYGLVVLSLMILTTSLVRAGGDIQWKQLDLFGGLIYVLAVDPTTPGTLYAGTRSGGVFKSSDSGATWTAANAGLTHLDVRALAIDPATPGALYAGTWDGGVFKSSNGGDTWTAANTGLTHLDVMALAVDPAMTSTLYAGTEGGGVFVAVNVNMVYLPLVLKN